MKKIKKFLLEKKYSWSTLLIIITSYCFDNGLFRFLFLIVGCAITIRLSENYENKQLIKIHEDDEKLYNEFLDLLGGKKDGE